MGAERRRGRLEGTDPEKPVATSQRMLKTIFSRIMMSSDVFGVGRDKSRQVDTDRGDNFNAFVPSSRVDNVTRAGRFLLPRRTLSLKRGDRVSIFLRPRSQCRLSPVKNFQFAFLFCFVANYEYFITRCENSIRCQDGSKLIQSWFLR